MAKYLVAILLLSASQTAFAQNSTYLGPCNGSVTQSDGQVIECPGERPECFDDGTCTCVADNQCN